MTSSQRYIPRHLAAGGEDFPRIAPATRTNSDPLEDTSWRTRDQLPGAKIGANRQRGEQRPDVRLGDAAEDAVQDDLKRPFASE